MITERDWQETVTDYARLRGWRIAHFRAARTSRGWTTPVAYDGAGFPDLILVRADRTIAAELKSATGRVSGDQQAWLDAFAVTGVESYVWRPSDFDEVVEVLT